MNEAEKWQGVSRLYRRAMSLALGRKSGKAEVAWDRIQPGLNTEEALAAKDNGTVLPDIGLAAMLMHRVRYIADGVVIGSKDRVRWNAEHPPAPAFYMDSVGQSSHVGHNLMSTTA